MTFDIYLDKNAPAINKIDKVIPTHLPRGR